MSPFRSSSASATVEGLLNADRLGSSAVLTRVTTIPADLILIKITGASDEQ